MNWITESVKRSNILKDHYKMHEIDIFIKDPLPKEINTDLVFTAVSKMVPSHLLGGVDIIYVGSFEVFKEKDTTAMYQDNAIYVSNNQSSDEDMIDDIIHEIAHSIEEMFYEKIYSDNTLEREFLGKRQRLYDRLKQYDYDPPANFNKDPYHSDEVDMYLYKGVGYETLWNLVVDLFPSPYSVTSLREYFAMGFEYYFMKSKFELKNVSPVLFSKLESLEYMED